MPKRVSELTALQLKNLKNGVHNVGGVKGLYFKKTDSQARFFLRYSDEFGRHDFSLGSYPQLSLAQARKKAFDTWQQIDSGKDPIREREEERKNKQKAIEDKKQAEESRELTFANVARQWIEDREKHGYWVNNIREPKCTIQILERNVYPFIGQTHIEEIDPEMVRMILEPIWQTKPSTAKKVKTYLRQIFQWAIALKKRKDKENPARMDGTLGVLIEPLQKNKKEKQNYASCPVENIPQLMAEIHSYNSTSARACEFSILTATRSKAVRYAQWNEFNLEKGIWVIPMEHDKIKKPNRDRTVFLSRQALTLLKNLPRFNNTELVFPSNRGSHLSDCGINMFLRGLHEKKFVEDGIGWIDPYKTEKTGEPCTITVHGTARATFRTWAKDDELGNNRKFDQEAVELCLLHSKNDAYNGAYDRARLEKERRFVMDCWGKYCYSRLNK